MPDLTRLETELRRLYPEVWVRHHLDSFSPAYFAAFTAEEIAQHLELVRALDAAQLVIALAWPAATENAARDEIGPDQWWVEVVGYDVFQFLSTVCNLLAVSGLGIVEGKVFTCGGSGARSPPWSRSTWPSTSTPIPRRPSSTSQRGTALASSPSRPTRSPCAAS
jgi:hypothetical protein